MKRLLCIISSMNTGGAETFLMKIYRRIDRTKYQFDFCLSDRTEGVYDKEILQLGGRIFYVPQKSQEPVASFQAIRKLVDSENYEYVMRINEHSLSTLDLMAARIGGAGRLIMRSSNANSDGIISHLLHKLFIFLPKAIPNVRIAPSTAAAEYTFGKNCIKKGKAQLLHNGVDLSVFRFDPEARREIRSSLSLGDRMIIGHIGRFNIQKNHSFLIEVFEKVHKRNPNTVMILVGDGPLRKEIEQIIVEKELEDCVVLVGIRQDIPQLLSAMDVFVFPSFYEGMPNTVIEAQATGLPCVISNKITPEADITGLVRFADLGMSSDNWAELVLDSVSVERRSTSAEFHNRGYEINQVVDQFVKIVFE